MDSGLFEMFCCRAEDRNRPKYYFFLKFFYLFIFFLTGGPSPSFCQLYTSNWMVAGEYHHLLSGTYWKLLWQGNLKVMFMFPVHVSFSWSSASLHLWCDCIDYTFELFIQSLLKAAASLLPCWVNYVGPRNKKVLTVNNESKKHPQGCRIKHVVYLISEKFCSCWNLQKMVNLS